MSLTIAIIAPGAMGSAVGQGLASHGAKVLTFVEGRSAATAMRAKAAGMVAASLAEIAQADVILSIVPPGEAVTLATTLAPVLTQTAHKPVYIDCNAINPATVQRVMAVLADTGCAFLDGGIIGLPPVQGGTAPTFYISGDTSKQADALVEYGLKVKQIAGPIGAASALKMLYAGITKGTTALGTAMLLAAERAGAAEGLLAELADSQPQVKARLARSIPDMYPKAYRWVAEMEEIAAFLGPDDPASGFFKAAAAVFARMADDRTGDGALAAVLNRQLGAGA